MDNKVVQGLMVFLIASMIFVIMGVTRGLGADITQDFQDDQTAGSYSYNITQNSLAAQDELSSKDSTLVTIIVAVVFIGLLLAAFFGKSKISDLLNQ